MGRLNTSERAAPLERGRGEDTPLRARAGERWRVADRRRSSTLAGLVGAGLVACGPSGTTGVPFDTVALGTWTASGGGTVTFAAGTGETDSQFLLRSECAGQVPFVWRYDPAPEDAAPESPAAYDSIAFAKNDAPGCRGNLNVGLPLLSVTETEFVIGSVSSSPPSPLQTFTKAKAATPGDCVMSAWTDWGACSRTCGGGERRRTRSIVTEPTNGGAACGAIEETEACNPEACPISAREARVVLYGGGAFVQIGSLRWVENDVSGVETFAETGRDDTTIRLDADDGSVQVEIDVSADEIRYRSAQTTVATKAVTGTNDARTNGWSARRVDTALGRFEQTGPTAWNATGAGPTEFVQLRRDEWSVYLLSADRARAAQLDLFKLEVYFRDTSTGATSTESITDAE